MDDRPDITPLMRACRQGDFSEVCALIDAGADVAGADVNASNRNGTTALMYAKTQAFASGDMRILTLLVSHGADMEARDNHGLRAIDYVQSRSDLLIRFFTKQHP